MMIPIFDSLTHPSINGSWIDSSNTHSNFIESLGQEMQESNVQWAFAAAMGTRNGYDFREYPGFIRGHSENLYPVSFADFEHLRTKEDVRSFIGESREAGYFGVKVHPRLSKISINHPLLPILITESDKSGLPVFLCTYFYSSSPECFENRVETLSRLLAETGESRVILLHGGGVHLLEMMEIARCFPSTLLDLSFTLCKYADSSIDLDIAYLFKNFDRRICIGSDHPTYALRRLRARFERFSDGLSKEKLMNIAHGNIFDFFRLEAD